MLRFLFLLRWFHSLIILTGWRCNQNSSIFWGNSACFYHVEVSLSYSKHFTQILGGHRMLKLEVFLRDDFLFQNCRVIRLILSRTIFCWSTFGNVHVINFIGFNCFLLIKGNFIYIPNFNLTGFNLSILIRLRHRCLWVRVLFTLGLLDCAVWIGFFRIFFFQFLFVYIQWILNIVPKLNRWHNLF